MYVYHQQTGRRITIAPGSPIPPGYTTRPPPSAPPPDPGTTTIQYDTGNVDGYATGATTTRGGTAPSSGGAGGTSSVPTERKPGLLDVPGEAESWWQQNRDRWRQPRRSQQYWNAQQGRRPNATSTNWDYVRGQLGGLGGSTSVRKRAGSIDAYERGRPGMGEDYAKRNASYFERPGEAEDFYGQHKGYFTTPGQGESWVRNNMSGFEKAGAAEGNYGNVRSSLAKGAQNTSNYFGATRGYATGRSAVDDERGYFAPSLRNQSYSERIFESGAGGLIDPYQRTLDKRTRDIRNAAAARGMLGTGAGLRAEAELGADVAAREAQDRIALAEQADTQRLGRAGAALDFASEAEQARMARLGFGLDASTAADASTRENLGLETDAARIAQDAMINRLFKGGQLGLQADEQGLSRMRAGADAARSAQDAGTRRVTSGMDVASQGQDLEMRRVRDEVQRLLDAAGLDIKADQLDMDTLDQIMKGAGQVDDQYNRDTTTDFNINRLLDRDDVSDLQDEFGMAERVQGLFEGREGGAYDRIAGNARDQAGFVGGSLSQATEEQKQMAQDVINALMQLEGMSAQQAQQMAEKLYQSGQLAIYAKLLAKK